MKIEGTSKQIQDKNPEVLLQLLLPRNPADKEDSKYTQKLEQRKFFFCLQTNTLHSIHRTTKHKFEELPRNQSDYVVIRSLKINQFGDFIYHSYNNNEAKLRLYLRSKFDEQPTGDQAMA